jgi:hypothetical protein
MIAAGPASRDDPMRHGSTGAARRGALLFLFYVLLAPAAGAADVLLTAPGRANVGAPVAVEWQGGTSPQEFITIVPAGTPEGRYAAYQYARQSPVELVAPEAPGSYEIRYLSAGAPYATLARLALTVDDVAATLEAPGSVTAGAEFAVTWSGPDYARDFITIVPAATPEGQYAVYAYTSKGSPLTLRAPDAPGEYELRYLLGTGKYRTLGRRPLTVGGSEASLAAPGSVAAGAEVEIGWQGPDNRQDFLTIVPAGTAERQYDAYVYTAQGNPARMRAPEVAGDYEIRYLSGQSYLTLASAPLSVTPVSATLEAPESAPARASVDVTWEGPGNPTDYVRLAPAGKPDDTGPYAMVTRGKTLRIATPDAPGDYELRYVTGSKHLVLGRRSITIVPRAAPGQLRVLDAAVGAADLGGTTVEVVLDASGSMLQRLDGKRRIDLAKAAITEFVNALPDGVGFALRVFGHREADACRSDLEIPAGPLDRGRAVSRVAAIEAMNLARTPIADSLRLAAADTAGRSGPLVLILVTDGEETCDGDPAAVIRELAASGTDVRVNIVGFAIDELMLQETFAEWARLGNGRYFNAADGAALAASLRQSVERSYSVLDGAGKVVASGTVNGPPVTLDAGRYRVVVPEEPARAAEDVTIEAEELTEISLGPSSAG